MSRYLTLLGVILAALVVLFYFIGLASAFLVVLIAVAVVLVGIGNLTGL